MLIGLITFICITIWLSFYIYLGSISLYSEAEKVITQVQKKRHALSEMTMAARERSILLLEMYIVEDVFDRDAIKVKLDYAASHFLKNRQIFEKSELSSKETKLFNEALQLISTNVPLQAKAAEMLIDNKMDSAGEILFHSAMPNQTNILLKFNEIHALIENDSVGKIASLKDQLNTTNRYILELIALIIGGAFVILIVFYFRFKNRERDLKFLVEERTRDLNKAHEQARSLIKNSSDGIISIDKDQNIVMFNPAAEKMFQYGASDVLGKPLTVLLPDEVQGHHHKLVTGFEEDTSYQARMMDSRPEVLGKRCDGDTFPAEVSICKTHIENETYYTAFVRDVTERRDAEAEIRRLALVDSLTGLDNRHHFERSFEEDITYHNRFPEHQFSLLLIDLDLFKQVNDTYGHPVGDKLLQRVAQILKNNVREVDRVGRLGGDEFAILLKEVGGENQAAMVSEKLIHALSQTHNIDGHAVQIGASIGIAICPETNADMEELFKHADNMLYASKAAGRNTYQIYSPQS